LRLVHLLHPPQKPEAGVAEGLLPAEAAEPIPAEKTEKPKRIITDEMVQKADGIIDAYKRGERRMAGPISTELLTAFAIKGARFVEDGLRSFAEWSKAMVAKHGDLVQPHLKPVWDSSQVTAMRTRMAEEELTSIKLASVNAARAARGLEPIAETPEETKQEWMNEARASIDKDPALPGRLVTVSNAYAEATDQYLAAKEAGDEQKAEEQRRVLEVYEAELQAMEEASKAAGAEWGRSGVARQLELKQDYSLAGMIRRARVANEGKPLSDKQRAKIKEQADRIAELEKQIAAAEKKLAEEAGPKGVDEVIKEAKKKERTRPGVMSQTEENEYQAALARIRASRAAGGEAGFLNP